MILSVQIPTTTGNREIVIIGGVAHLLVDFPCTARDNICPVEGCVIDGVTEGTELCFKCECIQATEATRPTTGELLLFCEAFSPDHVTCHSSRCEHKLIYKMGPS